MDMNADRVDRLDDQDWTLIMEAVERDHGLEDDPQRKARLAELAAMLIRPANRPLCSQCDGYAVDRLAGGLDKGLCGRCAAENHLASLLPEEFDDDASQDAILEGAVKAMAETWEAAKKLREQCEREESSVFPEKWYLWTKEVRGIMGWTEMEDGAFVRYYFTMAGDEDK